MVKAIKLDDWFGQKVRDHSCINAVTYHILIINLCGQQKVALLVCHRVN